MAVESIAALYSAPMHLSVFGLAFVGFRVDIPRARLWLVSPIPCPEDTLFQSKSNLPPVHEKLWRHFRGSTIEAGTIKVGLVR